VGVISRDEALQLASEADMDLVEVSPPHDQTGITSILAAQILMNAVGRIFYK